MATENGPDPRFLVVGLSPTIQRTLRIPALRINEVHRVETARLDVAGKGANTARVLTQIGESVRHLTHAGGADRDLWLAMADADGLTYRAIEAPRAVRNCITILEEDRGTTTELIEPSEPVSPEVVAAMRTAYAEELDHCETVIIAGSATAGYPEGFHAELVAAAKARGRRVVLDLHGKALSDSIRHNPDLLKINLREFLETFASDLAGNDSEHIDIAPGDPVWTRVEEQMRRWRERGIECVLTRGARPTLYWDLDAGKMRSVATVELTPVNTIGSGDAVTACLAARYFTEDRALAIEFAHSMAAINAGMLKPGTVR